MLNFDLLRDLERNQAETLCRHFFPDGKKEGSEWKLGDVSGAPGNSLGIQLTGPRAGLWHDRATGEGGDLLKLICLSGDFTLPQAVGQIERTLGINLRSGNQEPNAISNYPHPTNKPNTGKKLTLEGVERCSIADLWQIANLRSIPLVGLKLAQERKLLFAYEDPYQGRCWLVTDDARRNAIYRRLDGKRFHYREPEEGKKEGPKSRCWKGSEASWPIGMAGANGFPAIALTEGATDLLAAFWLAYAGAVDSLVAPVCMTGASCRIHDDALPMFRGKRVRIFGDADEAGAQAATRWAEQLRKVQAEVDGFDFSGLLKTDLSPVKDLNDFILADHKRSGCGIEIVTSAFDFALERRVR